MTSATYSAADADLRVIEPRRGWQSLGLRQLWRSRELLWFLAWRDLKVRYTQALFGAAWAVAQPLLLTAVFALFLGRLADVPSDGLPYAVFALSVLVPWTYFSNAVASASDSVVNSAAVITKVWFPRLLVPLAPLLAWFPDFVMATIVLIGLMAIYGIAPAATTVLLPLFMFGALLTAAAIGVWFAALNVAYRDVKYAVPFVLQIGLFATPIVYPAGLAGRWRWLFGLNPMAGVVEGFRWSLLGQGHPPWALMALSLAVTLVVLVSGLYYFRRVEHLFADVI